MSEYKRLTNNNADEYDPEYDFCIGCKYFGEPNGCNRPNGTCDNYERFIETYNRLAELEDKIENGTLIEIDKDLIGENIIGIHQFTDGTYELNLDENIVIGYSIDGVVTWNCTQQFNDEFRTGMFFADTEEGRAEAEVLLKELREKDK